MQRVQTLILEKGPLVRRAVLLLMVAGIPLFFYRPSRDPFNAPKISLLFIGVGIVAAIRLMEFFMGAPNAGLRRLAIPAALIATPLVVTWLLSPYKLFTLFGDYNRFQGFLPSLAFVLFGVLLADAMGGRVRWLAWTIAVTGTLVGIYAVIQQIGADPFKWTLSGKQSGFRVLSSIGNPDFVGGFLAIALAVTLGLWIYERRGIQLYVGAMAVTIGVGCGIAQAQGGWAAATAGVAITGGFILSERWRPAAALGAAAAVVVAAAVVGIVVFSMMKPDAGFIPSSISQRASAWQAAIGMFEHDPLVGQGPNSFALDGIEYRPLRDAIQFDYTWADDPHSVPLAYLSSMGLLGVIGFLGLLGWMVWAIRTAVDRAGPLFAGFAGGLVAYFVQSFVSIDEPSLRTALWATLAGLAITSAGLGEVDDVSGRSKVAKKNGKSTSRKTSSKNGRTPLPARRPAWQAAFAAPLVAVLGIWWGAGSLIAETRAADAERSFRANREEHASEQFQRAIAFTHYPQYRRDYAMDMSVTGINKGTDGGDQWFDVARAQFRHIDDLPMVAGLAQFAHYLYQWSTIHSEVAPIALEYATKAMDLDPKNPKIRVLVADILTAAGRPEDALDALRPFATDEIAKDYPEIWGAWALAEIRNGDEAGAREAIARAFAIDPEEPRAQR
ncbi:MAG TPA: O-antigen ligase family protein, partial [Actinomycetota bacterium]|nr:O-antigen ligase family protein [Actinomycetota bacterium]